VATGEKPILVLSAPKGSGKSTIAKFLVNLIDATKSPLLPAVGNRRSLAVQSKHRWIFAYDNLSHLSVDQQDAMCCASTGAGYIERKLFTDDEVVSVAYIRPQILTSVDLVPTRSDLLDRCLLVKVKPIPEADRKNVEELDQLFRNYHAEILGAFLDLLWVAVKNLDSVKQPLQRMASFHKLGLAAGIEGFNDAYLACIGNAQAEAVRVNPIADAIAEDDPKVQKLTSRTLGRLLNSTLKPDLDAIGIDVDSYRESNVTRTRKILITRTDKYGNLMSETSKTSKAGAEPAQNKASEFGHQLDVKENASNFMSNQCPASEPAQNKASKPQLDDMDVMDVKTDHVSDPEDEGEW
jgi:energy-coupling factor transporter ATP-binding protein EcfA2